MSPASSRHYPLVSILMPTFNQAGFIEASLRSILKQNYPALEILVMDGASTDSTAQVVGALQAEYPQIRFYSEADTGPAQALNRGLSKARGSVIGWLNSDDLYCEQAIMQAVAQLMESDLCLMVYGNAQHINQSGQVLSDYPSLPPSRVNLDPTLGCFICQPTVFFKHTMAVMLGPFNENLKTAFDFEYWLRAFQRFHGRIQHMDLLWAQSRLHDNCITMKQRRTVIKESMNVIAHYAGQVSARWLHTYFNEVSSTLGNEALRQADLQALLGEVESMIDPHDLSMFKKQILKVA